MISRLDLVYGYYHILHWKWRGRKCTDTNKDIGKTNGKKPF